MKQEVGFPFGRRPARIEVSLAPPISVIPTGGVSKRLFDVTFALITLILFSPLFVLTASAIKLCDDGPVFFSHTRVGFLGRPFRCLKFRTMAVDADQKLAACLATDDQIAVEWAAKRKLRDDPRLIPIGAALRRSSLDELPQLINILRGEMSLVGPRPVVAEELAYYGADASLYVSVRPGLTGAWQVGGRSDTSYETRVQMDRHYCLNWSMLSDFIIIVKTIPVVIFARGSY
jgi:exopolysaccharide production protein ExoY